MRINPMTVVALVEPNRDRLQPFRRKVAFNPLPDDNWVWALTSLRQLVRYAKCKAPSLLLSPRTIRFEPTRILSLSI